MLFHNLHIEIPETSSETLMKIFDMSAYNSLVAPTCAQLLIKSPGFEFTQDIDVSPNFNLTITACDLGIQKKRCEQEYNNIPDGIYAIRYSVAPNNQVFVEYNHLRLTQAKNKLMKIYCNLDLSTCLSNTDKADKIRQVQEVELYLNGAKAAVEVCHETQRGLKMYDHAIKLLDKITCKTC